MTRSWDDERISRLVERAGLEGYGFYFRLVEIIAANMEENSEPNATYSAQKWSKLTAIFKPKVQKLCEVCSNLGLIEFEINSDLLKVSIPKIIKYRDEYSVRQGRKKVKSPDTVGTLSGVAPEQEQIQIQMEKQIQNMSCEEKPKRKIASTYTEDFEKFWRAYPSKVGKADAAKKFQKAIKIIPFDSLISAVERYCKSKKVLDGYVCNPATWLHQERWNDLEVTVSDDPSRPPGAVRKTASGWWLDKDGAVIMKPEFS